MDDKGIHTKKNNIVQEIRSFNRFYTGILGLLNRHILNSPYSLTEVRVLFEIDKMKDCTANKIMEKLDMDRGYMSRIVKQFQTKQLITKKASPTDGRSSILHLTPLGKGLLSDLENKSSQQVGEIIAHLTESEQVRLIETMKQIQNTLIEGVQPITIRTFRPEDVQTIIKRHRELYESEYGFTSEFGDYVAKYMVQFQNHYDPEWENIWIAVENETVVGVIAIVHVDDVTAQLRWFLIEPRVRGRRLGHRLMQTAIEFCREKKYHHVRLWTVSTLDAARHLYQSYGFTLTETKANNTWANHLTEERWDLDLKK